MSTRLLVTECFNGDHAACRGYNGPADNPNYKCDCDCHQRVAPCDCKRVDCPHCGTHYSERDMNGWLD